MGQEIYTVLTGSDPDQGRLFLSHKELLGTWLENAAGFPRHDRGRLGGGG